MARLLHDSHVLFRRDRDAFGRTSIQKTVVFFGIPRIIPNSVTLNYSFVRSLINNF